MNCEGIPAPSLLSAPDAEKNLPTDRPPHYQRSLVTPMGIPCASHEYTYGYSLCESRVSDRLIRAVRGLGW